MTTSTTQREQPDIASPSLYATHLVLNILPDELVPHTGGKVEPNGFLLLLLLAIIIVTVVDVRHTVGGAMLFVSGWVRGLTGGGGSDDACENG